MTDSVPVPSRRDRGYEQIGDINWPETCAGCGDQGEFWMHGDWYCFGCASCDVCESPYCDNEDHR